MKIEINNNVAFCVFIIVFVGSITIGSYFDNKRIEHLATIQQQKTIDSLTNVINLKK